MFSTEIEDMIITTINDCNNFPVAQLPPLPVPELKNGMKSHSSVVLHWNSRRLTNVTYYVQARMPDTGTPWEITMATWLGDGDINVTDLRPFVTYKVIFYLNIGMYVQLYIVCHNYKLMSQILDHLSHIR